MSYMAVLTPHPLYAAPSCSAFSPSNCRLQPSCSCHTSTPVALLAAAPTPPPLLSVSSSCGECKASGPEHSAHFEPDEAYRERPLFWLGLLLQSETRRSFITTFLQTLASRLFSRCSSQLPPTQFSIATKSNVLARRVALMIPFVVAASAPCNSLALNVITDETANIGRSFLQNLGIGDRDIYYPRLFEGSWICSSTLVAVDTPQGEEKADPKSIEFSRKQLGYTVTYKARFIPFNKYVIGDRLFTTLSLVESTVGSNVVDHGVWSSEQPDRLTLVLRGGLKVQNVVTKRSSLLSGPGQFDTSEYSQQIFDNNRIEGGPPTIKASQNQTRYRWDTTNEIVSDIEAFQRVSMFPVIQESLSNVDILNLNKPVTVYKYIVRFRRESS